MVPRLSKNILLLLGAGASAPFSFPTTTSMLNIIRHEIPENQVHFLDEIINQFRFNDVEPLYNLLFNINRIVDENSDLEKLLKRFATFGTNKAALSWAQYHELLKKVYEVIRQSIYQHYSMTPDKIDDIVKVYTQFFEVLNIFQRDRIVICTTNYDKVIETLFEHMDEFDEMNIIEGFIHENKYPKKECWNPDLFTNSKEGRNAYLLKLHGSLNWRQYKDKIIRVDDEIPLNPDIYQREFIIYPGDKVHELELEPYRTLHEQFLNHLTEVNLCICLGFTFRDKWINDIFVEAIGKNLDLHIVIINKTKDAAENFRKLIMNRLRLDFQE